MRRGHWTAVEELFYEAASLEPPGRAALVEAWRQRAPRVAAEVESLLAHARLQHPGIATFYEAGEADGGTFIAMEYVQGQLLRRRLTGGPVPGAEALSIARQLLAALAHAHAAGIVHRDIKPENIIVTPAGAAKLLDCQPGAGRRRRRHHEQGY